MNRISVGEAVSAGFKVVGREPLAFAVWCAVVFVIYGLPQILMVTSLGPLFQAAIAGAEPTDPRIAEGTAAMMRYQPLTYLAYLVLMLILPGAIFRTVLRPEERAVLFLKVGAAELWTLLVSLVLMVGWIVALIAVMIPLMIAAGFAVAAGGGGDGAAAVTAGAVVVMFVAMALTLWPLLRFSLAPVMAFADRTFRLPESWRLTKGHAGRMFLVGLSLLAIIIVVELVFVAGGIGVVAATGAFRVKDPMQALAQLGMPALVAGVAAWSVLIGFTYVLWLGAWAEIYRQLRPPLASTFD